MPPKTSLYSKPTYFNSPKKQPLVRKMIFDPHELHVPASCYELRPINQSESNQQDNIFDHRSNSMREIQEFDKNSPFEIDRIMFGQHDNSNQSVLAFIDCDRGENSAQFHFNFKNHQESNSLSEDYHHQPIKRENPISYQEAKIHEKISKIVRVSEPQEEEVIVKQEEPEEDESIEKIPQYFSFHSPVSKQKPKKPDWTSFSKSCRKPKWTVRYLNPADKNDQIFNEDMESEENQQKQPSENSQFSCFDKEILVKDEVKVEEISPDIQVFQKRRSPEKKLPRKRVDNPEFELVNQYMELASYAALIDEMIMVYDKSPLFEFPLDFDSETDGDDDEEEIVKKEENQKSENQVFIQEDVKIQYVESEKSVQSVTVKNKKPSRSEKELYNQFEQLKIEEATDEKDKQRIIKEINFHRSKMYCNFFEPIKELKPYMKKMSLEEKKLYLAFKKELKEIKDILDHFERKRGDKKDHICKLCGEEFESGRQLGGHMSRKHPGKAIEYGFKKELHRIKEIERNRRKYFKTLDSEKPEKR